MHYTSLFTRRAVLLLRVTSAVFFVLFSLFYLIRYQSGIIALEQHYFSGGQTSYNAYFGAVSITLVLFLLGLGIQRLISFPIRILCTAWFPSFFLLGIVSCLHIQEGELCLSAVHFGWIFVFAVCMAMFFLFAYFRPDLASENKPLSTYIYPNAFFLSLFASLTCCIGNDDPLTHFELQASQYARQQKFDKALSVGKRSTLTSPYLTAVRCYAMAQQDCLGDRLFSYTLPSGSHSLLPEIGDTNRVCNVALDIYRYLGAVPRDQYSRNHVTEFLQQVAQLDSIPRPQVQQFQLCAYLLDKDLIHFDSLSAQLYDTLSILPRHYMEAKALNDLLEDKVDSVRMQDSIQVELQKFLSICRENSGSPDFIIANKCREHYAKTYWFYFFYNHR